MPGQLGPPRALNQQAELLRQLHPVHGVQVEESLTRSALRRPVMSKLLQELQARVRPAKLRHGQQSSASFVRATQKKQLGTWFGPERVCNNKGAPASNSNKKRAPKTAEKTAAQRAVRAAVKQVAMLVYLVGRQGARNKEALIPAATTVALSRSRIRHALIVGRTGKPKLRQAPVVLLVQLALKAKSKPNHSLECKHLLAAARRRMASKQLKIDPRARLNQRPRIQLW